LHKNSDIFVDIKQNPRAVAKNNYSAPLLHQHNSIPVHVRSPETRILFSFRERYTEKVDVGEKKNLLKKRYKRPESQAFHFSRSLKWFVRVFNILENDCSMRFFICNRTELLLNRIDSHMY